MACGRCGLLMRGTSRASLPPYPDGSPVRNVRCRKDASHFGCGRNSIDAAAAEAIVAEAVKRRRGDPRRADRLAARLAVVRAQRPPIETEVPDPAAAAANPA